MEPALMHNPAGWKTRITMKSPEAGGMETSGRWTAEMTRRLEEWLRPQGFDVLCDHGEAAAGQMGEIVAWFGIGGKPTMETRLAEIDMAVVRRHNGRTVAQALIEIEESDAPPKHLLGDVLCTLAADHVSFRGEELLVNERTTLILLARGTRKHDARMSRLMECVRACQPKALGRLKAIEQVFGELFESEEELEEKLRRLVGEAVRGR